MSGIDELVKQHAPNGVEYRTLRDFGTWSGGITPTKSVSRYWQDGTIPWVASMDISATAGREIRGRVTPAAIDETSLRLIPGPSIAVVMRSNVLRRFLPVGYLEVDATVNQDLRVLRPSSDLDPRYVYLALRAASERIRTSCVRTDGSMAAVDSQAFFDWRLPVPPPEVQQEVVRTLTKLEALQEELEAALQAELQARREQFVHYRNAILTFEPTESLSLSLSLSLSRRPERYARLSDLFDLRAGKFLRASQISAESVERQAVPCFGGGGLRGYVAVPSHTEDRILIGRQGALCGSVRRVRGPFYATEHAVVVNPKRGVDERWAFHVLTWMNLHQYASKSAQPGLAVANIARLQVPVPTLGDQQAIGCALDRFDALVGDLSLELPAETAARRKQYEHYRDKLLTFEEAA